MKRFLQRAAAIALLLGLALIAPARSAGALALPDSDPLVYAAPGGGELELTYVPPANSDYAVYLFSADGEEVEGSAELTLDGETVASGEGRGALCSAWLVAGESYTLRVRCAGAAIVEIARNALSRCQGDPLVIAEGAPAGKMIARAYDAHWYRFEAAADGRLMLTCVPEDPDLELHAMLFDDSGALISEFETLPGGACLLISNTLAGQNYHVRVCAPRGETGYYVLNLNRSAQGTITSALRFDDVRPRTLAAGSAMLLADELYGEALLWASDAPDIAAVTQDGAVIALAPGMANITAYGVSSQAVCPVEVVDVPLEGLRILNARLELSVGDEAAIGLEFTPQNASNRSASFEAANPEIVSVTDSGVLTGLAPGETTVTVTSADGRLSDAVAVAVFPAGRKYRALLVGEQNYPFGVNAQRNGSENSVNALAALLESGRFESTDYAVRTGSDLSRAELIAEIRTCFRDATAQDVSLFYITCHGTYAGGMSFLELSDGSTLSARDLERELRRIPGTVVVLIDCCGSGGAIGAASQRVAFAKGFAGAFASASIRGSKYKVIASAGLDEDSYRLAFNEESVSGVMATVFARALCDGAGWDIDRNARGTMGADADYDGSITLDELAEYAAGRVDYYLARASELTGTTYRQSVQVYPKGDPFLLFE